MKNQYEDFEDFIEWLKNDGLKPKSSERLWRKKIFANLQNGHKKSLVNYADFLTYKQLNSLLGKRIIYKDINALVTEVKQEQQDCLLFMQNQQILRIKLNDLDSFIDKIIQNKGK